jgi:opacity protein-like surface antigen
LKTGERDKEAMVKATAKSLTAVLLIGGFLMIGVAHAQTESTSKLSWAGEAGLTLGKLSYSPSGIDKKFRPGFRIGAFGEYAIQPMIAIDLGLLFNAKGVKYENVPLGGGVTAKVTDTINYLSIPLLAKLRFTNGNSIAPYIFAGPQLGIRLQAKEKTEPSTGASTDVDIKDTVKSTEFGLDFGAGLEFPVSDMKFLIEGGYDAGLTDIVNNPPAGSPTLKTQTVHFELGLRF